MLSSVQKWGSMQPMYQPDFVLIGQSEVRAHLMGREDTQKVVKPENKYNYPKLII